MSIISSHYVIYWKALAAKMMSSELKNVLEICIKVVNTINSRALNSRIFKNYLLSIQIYYFIQRCLFQSEYVWPFVWIKVQNENYAFTIWKRSSWEFYWWKLHILLCISIRVFETTNNLNTKYDCHKQQRFYQNISRKDPAVETPSKQRNFYLFSIHRLNELPSNEEEPFYLAALKNIVIQYLDSLIEKFIRYFPDHPNER